MTATVRLETVFDRSAGAGGATARLTLTNAGPQALGPFRLALTSIVPLRPGEGSGVRVVRRVSVYHELARDPALELGAGETLELGPFAVGFPVRHANDGPSSAFLIAEPSGEVLAEADVAPCRTVPDAGTAPAAPVPDAPDGMLVLPWPARVTAAGSSGVRRWSLPAPDAFAAPVWQVVRDLTARLFPGEDERLLAPGAEGAEGSGRVAIVRAPDGSMADDASTVRFDGERVEITAAHADGLRSALITMAQMVRAAELRPGRHRVPATGTIEDAPRFGWRGLHLDVARWFRPAGEVTRLLDLVAWRKLDRLHLHLTDDEGWRVPVAGYPALTDIGAWRGHGRPVPPLLGSGPDPTGGWYTADDVAGWRRRAAELGVVLVPEIDLPAHSFAALAAVPELRDPNDTGDHRSVQGFAANVLNPGVAATRPFLEAVLGTVADLFDPRWIHVGGDEVPRGAWDGSPAAARWASARGVTGTDGIAAAFMRDVIGFVRDGLGREVGVWEEAATSGALRPGDGYVVPWQSAEVVRTLAAVGHRLVAAPAERCYLDLVVDEQWATPGLSWSGPVSLEDAYHVDPAALVGPAGHRLLDGLQACLWSEVVPTPERVDDQLVGRLDALAERAWSPSTADDIGRVRAVSSIAPRLAG